MVRMNQKMLAIAAIVTAAALTGIFSSTPMAAYAGGGDESETNCDHLCMIGQCSRAYCYNYGL